jgi:hypothetical protein
MEERLAPGNVEALRTLAQTVEPVKGYGRGRGNTADTPLNALPDSVPPESMAARKFSLLVDRIVAGNAQPDDLVRARDLMQSWKLNHDRLAPSLQSLPLSQDAQISQNLSNVATIGLQALDLLNSRQSPAAGWVDQQTVQLEEMKKRQGDLLLMIVAPIEKLVQQTGKQSS